LSTSSLTVLFVATFMLALLMPTVSFAQENPDEVAWEFTPYDSNDWDYEGDETNVGNIADQGFLPYLQVAMNGPAESVRILYHQLAGPSKLTVFDLGGNVHHEVAVGADYERQGTYQLNTSHLSPGMYMIRLSNGVYTTIKKVLVR
ncbi:MAG: T9SS type A sorting domain-containing protein, partial [Bacteroidota bacterium]